MPKDNHRLKLADQSGLSRWLRLLGLILVVVLTVVLTVGIYEWETPEGSGRRRGPGRRLVFHNQSQGEKLPHRSLPVNGDIPHINVWWDDVPVHLQDPTDHQSSNIHPADYAGPESCRECHQKNYESWSDHPHRWMNAMADASTVVGDFSGTSISYLGGEVTFFQQDGEYRMRLEREETQTYAIHETIGSRFFQYYIGKQIDGPEAAGQATDPQRLKHVLPLGYWIEHKQWVPIVNVTHEEVPDGQRMDPFEATSYQANFAHYADACDQCHTTSPLGDMLSGNANQLAREVPCSIQWAVSDYLAEERPDWLPSRHRSLQDDQAVALLNSLDAKPASEHVVSLGISCEACHLGCREHVDNPKVMPAFFPHSPHLTSGSWNEPTDLGRTHQNVNWACGRCHSGDRPQYAGGMSTWNSTEYSDAMRGSCYTQLTCIHCHNPHQATGQKWLPTPAEDDARCIQCHQQYASDESRAAHSHHQLDSEGSHCMNCHMPRINEGLQDIVRTHTIYSPTNIDMIHANQPNACNQCHTERSIDWTIDHLEKWFDSEFDTTQVQDQYPDRDQSAALGWLQSDNEAVRKVAVDALFRTKPKWSQDTTIQDALINALNDPYLINRQFALRGFEEMLGTPLQDYGYRFYMTAEERAEPLAVLRKVLRAKFATMAIRSDE